MKSARIAVFQVLEYLAWTRCPNPGRTAFRQFSHRWGMEQFGLAFTFRSIAKRPPRWLIHLFRERVLRPRFWGLMTPP
jgi:hypothetical protein